MPAALAQGVGDRNERENAFRSENGDSWRIVWDDDRETPNRVFMGESKRYNGAPLDIARSFLQENDGLFSMSPGFSDLVVRRVQTHNGFRHVKFQQTLHGIPIEDATYAVHITPDGRVDMANGTYYKNLQGDSRAGILESDANLIAERHARSLLPSDIVVPRESLEAKLAARSAALVFDPLGNGQARLSWKVVVSAPGTGFSWTVLLDANNGVVVDAHENIVRHAIGGERKPAAGSREVSAPDAANSSSERFLVEPLLVSRDAAATGYGYAYPEHPDLGNYTVKALPRLDSPFGSVWRLRGSFARVENDAASDAANTNGNFYYSTSSTHFQEVNLYYHVDRFRADFLDPLGLSWFYGKQVAHAHTPPVFGGPRAWFDPDDGELYFNDGYLTGFEDFGLEDKVIYHEFGHGVNFYIEPGITTTNSELEEGAISEGVPDYLAAALTGREEILEYAAPQHQRDIGDPEYATLEELEDAENPPADAYDFAELLSSLLWDVRQLGQTDGSLFDELVFGTLFRLSTEPDFEEFRDALLAEDRAVNAGQYVSFISAAFEDVGVGEEEVDNLSAGIGGPTCLGPSEAGTFYLGFVGGGVPPYSQEWYFYASCGEAALPCGQWTVVGSGGTSVDVGHPSAFSIKARVTDSEDSQAWSQTIHVEIDPTGFCASKQQAAEGETGDESVPKHFEIRAAFPNPFTDEITFELAIPERAQMRVAVHDLMGRLLSVLHDAEAQVGTVSISWYASDRPSGVYVLSVEYGGAVSTKLLVRS